jgi:hypothetical protein
MCSIGVDEQSGLLAQLHNCMCAVVCIAQQLVDVSAMNPGGVRIGEHVVR